jgi:hypothetical protein
MGFTRLDLARKSAGFLKAQAYEAELQAVSKPGEKLAPKHDLKVEHCCLSRRRGATWFGERESEAGTELLIVKPLRRSS